MSLWVINSNGWFIQEWSKRLFLMKGLWIIGSHKIRSKRGFVQKLNTAVLLRDAEQFCYGSKVSYVLCKIEQKHNILFKI